MSSAVQSVLIVLAIIFSFVWLQIPALEYFSLQLVALVVLLYFVVKIVNKKRSVHFAPTALTPEISLITIAFLVCIGSTGNLDSLFYPLSYIYLFFLVITLTPFPAIMASLAVMAFFYLLTPSLSAPHLSALLSLPLLLLVFLFTKKHYESHKSDQQLIDSQGEILQEKDHRSLLFVRTFLQPKLETLFELSFHPDVNKKNIQEQIKLVYEESEQLLNDIDQDTQRDI